MAEVGIWKPIPGHAGYYASTAGEIKREYKNGKNRILTAFPRQNKKGGRYLNVKLHRKDVKVAHLIYKTFYGEIPAGMSIIHVNGDYTDNSVNNLRTATKRETGLLFGGHNGRRKPVMKFDRFGNVVDVFPSVRAAARASNISYSSVSDNCNKLYGYLAGDGYHYEWDENIKY